MSRTVGRFLLLLGTYVAISNGQSEPVWCQFQCSNGKCIANALLCDTVNDCGDWSDEMKCRESLQQQLESESNCYGFICNDNSCIDSSLRCDKRPDCFDGSDERNCTVPDACEGFRCYSDGQCIDITKRCTGINDCSDGSDEYNCPHVDLLQNCKSFRCDRNSICVTSDQLCDGVYDCRDWSDEYQGYCKDFWDCITTHIENYINEHGQFNGDPPSAEGFRAVCNQTLPLGANSFRVNFVGFLITTMATLVMTTMA